MKSKPVIAIDIDDVLSSQLDIIIEFSNLKLNNHFTKEDFMAPGNYRGYFESVWGLDKETGHKLFNEFLEDHYPLKQVVREDVKDAIKILKNSYNLIVVTSRGVGYEEITRKWLIEQVPNTFDEIHFVHDWHTDDKQATKALICQELGAEYLVDDSLEHCNLASEVGVKALLFGKYGWNIEKPIEQNVLRVNNWLEVLEFFEDERRKF